MIDSRAELEELIDRQRIWECLLRYTRGMDRLDRDLVMSAYHSDAWEDHGAFLAPGEGFADTVLHHHRENEVSTQHIMSNHHCEIDGDEAHAETYVRCYSVNRDGNDSISFGRFVDRLEKRDGRWGIVERVSLREGSADLTKNDFSANHVMQPQSIGHPRRDRSDPSYVRPLRISRG